MRTIQLEKSSMAFKLEDGTILLISKEDVSELAGQLVTEMMINDQSAVYMVKDFGLERANMLYKVMTEQIGDMTKQMKHKYLKDISDHLTGDNNTALQTLKEKVKEQ